MIFRKKKQEAITNKPENQETEKLKDEIKNETEYLKKLISKFYNNPNNEWKQRLKYPYLYMGGKTERVKEDQEYYNNNYDKRNFILDPTIKEMHDTEKRLKILKGRLRTIENFDSIIAVVDDNEYEDDENEVGRS